MTDADEGLKQFMDEEYVTEGIRVEVKERYRQRMTLDSRLRGNDEGERE